MFELNGSKRFPSDSIVYREGEREKKTTKRTVHMGNIETSCRHPSSQQNKQTNKSMKEEKKMWQSQKKKEK